MRIAHLSDIHFGGENKAAVAATFDRLAAQPPDLTVISGDLTVAGAAAEFAMAAEWTAALAARGCPLLVLPGNHDTPALDIPVRLTNPWGRWRKAFGPSDGVAFDAPGLKVVAFNSARGVQPRLNWSKGAVDRRQALAAARGLAAAPPGVLRIAACHHPLVELPGGPMSGRVWGGTQAAQALAEAKADLVLTGHIHAPFAMAYPFGDGQTQAVGASTLSLRERGVPAGYNLIETDGPEIRVTAFGWGGHAFTPWRTWAFARRETPARPAG